MRRSLHPVLPEPVIRRVDELLDNAIQFAFDGLFLTGPSKRERLRAAGCPNPEEVLALPFADPIRERWVALLALADSNLPDVR